jgi:hypothetical protein
MAVFNIFLKSSLRGRVGRGSNYLLDAGLATTSPIIFKYFSGVTAFDLTTIVLLNG